MSEAFLADEAASETHNKEQLVASIKFTKNTFV